MKKSGRALGVKVSDGADPPKRFHALEAAGVGDIESSEGPDDNGWDALASEGIDLVSDTDKHEYGDEDEEQMMVYNPEGRRASSSRAQPKHQVQPLQVTVKHCSLPGCSATSARDHWDTYRPMWCPQREEWQMVPVETRCFKCGVKLRSLRPYSEGEVVTDCENSATVIGKAWKEADKFLTADVLQELDRAREMQETSSKDAEGRGSMIEMKWYLISAQDLWDVEGVLPSQLQERGALAVADDRCGLRAEDGFNGILLPFHPECQPPLPYPTKIFTEFGKAEFTRTSWSIAPGKAVHSSHTDLDFKFNLSTEASRLQNNGFKPDRIKDQCRLNTFTKLREAAREVKQEQESVLLASASGACTAGPAPRAVASQDVLIPVVNPSRGPALATTPPPQAPSSRRRACSASPAVTSLSGSSTKRGSGPRPRAAPRAPSSLVGVLNTGSEMIGGVGGADFDDLSQWSENMDPTPENAMHGAPLGRQARGLEVQARSKEARGDTLGAQEAQDQAELLRAGMGLHLPVMRKQTYAVNANHFEKLDAAGCKASESWKHQVALVASFLVHTVDGSDIEKTNYQALESVYTLSLEDTEMEDDEFWRFKLDNPSWRCCLPSLCDDHDWIAKDIEVLEREYWDALFNGEVARAVKLPGVRRFFLQYTRSIITPLLVWEKQHLPLAEFDDEGLLLSTSDAVEEEHPVSVRLITNTLRAMRGALAVCFPEWGELGSSKRDVDYVWPQSSRLSPDDNLALLSPNAKSLCSMFRQSSDFRDLVTSWRGAQAEEPPAWKALQRIISDLNKLSGSDPIAIMDGVRKVVPDIAVARGCIKRLGGLAVTPAEQKVIDLCKEAFEKYSSTLETTVEQGKILSVTTDIPQLLKTIGQVTNAAEIKIEIESLTMHIVESCSKWNMTILSEAPCVVAKMLACVVIACGLVGRVARLICL